MEMKSKFSALQNEFGIRLTRDVEKEVESMSYNKDVVESDWKARSDKAVAERDEIEAERDKLKVRCDTAEAMCGKLVKDITSKDRALKDMAVFMYESGASMETIAAKMRVSIGELERILGKRD